MAEPYDRRGDAAREALRGLGERVRHPAAVRQRIDALETVLERSIELPVALPLVGKRVGLDAVLGLIPVVGDVIGGLLGAYAIWEARNLGMSKFKIARMMANTGFDTAIGLVPLVGDYVDAAFKSNTRNLRIVRKHLDKHHPETGIIEGEVLEPR